MLLWGRCGCRIQISAVLNPHNAARHVARFMEEQEHLVTAKDRADLHHKHGHSLLCAASYHLVRER